nr:MAG: hypothetical protein [Molluscum contagiosum virus]
MWCTARRPTWTRCWRRSMRPRAHACWCPRLTWSPA